MDVVYERCCGLDVHKKLVVACVVVPGPDGRPTRQVRRFDAMTDDLLALADWLGGQGVTHVAMESTGVYWQPVWNLLEERFTLLLANARHIKAVPGRKTDVRDCEWLADLLRHGLIQGSFVPDRPTRELRELTRYRTSLIEERAAEVNRLQKTLEGANIKLAAVASNVVGVSGREILAALVGGTTDAAALAELARGRLRAKLPELERALSGRVSAHQRFLVARQLAHVDDLDELIAQVSAEIAERLRPFAPLLARLDAIPGIGPPTAEVIVAELGGDVERFPTHRHFSAWAGLSPGANESGGKRRAGTTRKGNRALRTALVRAAHAAARTRSGYFAAQYRRLAARRGAKKAVVAVAHAIGVTAYHLVRDPDRTYTDLGPNYFDERDRQALERRLIHRLEHLGYRVTLEPVAA